MPEEPTPIKSALEAYQKGRTKIYEASGMKDYDDLGKIYQGTIEGYMQGKIDNESAALAIRFSELLDAFRKNPLIKDEIDTFEKEMFKQPMFKSYLTLVLYNAKVSAELQRRTSEEGIKVANKNIQTADNALKRYGVEFKEVKS